MVLTAYNRQGYKPFGFAQDYKVLTYIVIVSGIEAFLWAAAADVSSSAPFAKLFNPLMPLPFDPSTLSAEADSGRAQAQGDVNAFGTSLGGLHCHKKQ